MRTIIELANRVHYDSMKMGWWASFETAEDRHGELMIWAVSEICEAWIGHRKKLMDNRLPHYPMFDVELADVCIVLLDLWEAYSMDDRLPDLELAVSAVKLSLRLHPTVAERCFYVVHMMGKRKTKQGQVIALMAGAIALAELYGVALEQIIREKIEFNSTREDHRTEAGARKDG